MIEQIHQQNLIDAFRREFPEIEDRFQAEREFWDGKREPTNYDFVGFVFKPYFKQEIERGEINDFLRRSAAFIERVCETGDKEAVNVIWIKLFEWLLPRPRQLELLWPEFGEKTRASIEDAASRWGYSLEYLHQRPTIN